MSRTVSIQADPYRGPLGNVTHDTRKTHHDVGTQDFVAIDGEGSTFVVIRNNRAERIEHRYVLLGVGQDQIENIEGLTWGDILEFIASKYRPRTGFVGFYLGYDFTHWIKTLPENRARALLTIEGRESRRSKSVAMHGRFLPVDVDSWQIDILGSKRFGFRRKECDCLTVKCPHPKGPWIYVCDAGGFFQTSFLNVINPENWQTPIITDEEYRTILVGKEKRSSAALDDDMRFYNRLENEILERVMRDLNTGFQKLDVNLSPKQWFGPGQAAQSWMRGRAPSHKDVAERVPEWFLDAARQSYFGGWFEITAHGIIPGTCYENDINNAYPYIISRLPCLLHGVYSRGVGAVPDNLGTDSLVLVRALVWGRPPDSDSRRGNGLGAMPHRDRQGRISRPLVTSGWYWKHELDAAIRAKCVTRVRASRMYEWVAYTPCDCLPPLRQVKHLYQMRLDVGKKSSLGKAAKLTNNSIYGKTAQSIGAPQFANPIYASLITAGCRTMILDAIATHPKGKHNVVMVATDGVYFLDPHPFLTYGKGLGEWEQAAKINLTLFKPGVYWDDTTRAKLSEGGHPSFKARGISARDFAGSIAQIDDTFASWGDNPPSITEDPAPGGALWPKVKFRSQFAMTTALQALVRNDWESAGHVEVGKEMVQSANPADKRHNLWLDSTSNPGRPIYRSEPWTAGKNAVYRHAGNIAGWDEITDEDFSSVPYEKRFGLEDPFSDEVTQAFGISPDEHRIGWGMFRVMSGQE
jgi:hypothetical protein